ncbi:MAG TPA: YbaK/EbsC family protein [Acidimicrobiia bacterium]|nr:YbaK/EbsC family protein [Acidimicrobiia bacterium]
MTPALADPRLAGLDHTVVRHGRVSSLEEAAALRGVDPASVIKTLVVRRADDDYLFVLVPGDRVIDWQKLRSLTGERRLSMPDAAEALIVTGYERGTITPFGAVTQWPVIADAAIAGATVSIGGGAHGVSITVDGASLIEILGATVADVTSAHITDGGR